MTTTGPLLAPPSPRRSTPRLLETPAVMALPEPGPALGPEPLPELLRRVALRVPPAFPLEDLVAVNPFLGYAGVPFLEAHEGLRAALGADILPPLETFREAFARGRFGRADVEVAIARTRDGGPTEGRAPGVDEVLAALEAPAPAPARPPASLAARIDAATGSGWAPRIAMTIGRACASRFDRGVASLALPLPASTTLFDAWRAYAAHDLSIDASGLRGARAFLRALPADPVAACETCLGHLGVASGAREAYLGQLLGEIPGWAGLVRQRAWSEGHEAIGELPHLLAIRLAYDAALRALHPRGAALARSLGEEPHRAAAVRRDEDRRLRYTLLLAAERGYRRSLAALPAVRRERRSLPAVQAVFCIDVRSEPFRRHLEAVAPAVETYGFAGFFGLPIAIEGAGPGGNRLQCPPLLAPTHTVRVEAPAESPLRRQLGALLGYFRQAASGGFAYVETLGFLAAAPMIGETLGLRRGSAPHEHRARLDLQAIPLAERRLFAQRILGSLGLERPYARVVLLVGHESFTENNPQGAALACGACAGHSGAVNARMAARLLNDPAVRAGLGEPALPADTVFVAGVHDTGTDEVRLLDLADVPASHAAAVEELRQGLAAAGARRRAERGAALPGAPSVGTEGALADALHRRTRHWAEVQPEWGLANNAAFVVAPRHRTRGLDLGGRAFLHSYDAARDHDGAALALVLTAPVVVASWINLQYYASTVDPLRFGSGNKTVHNVVGGLGVAVGNELDLAAGLARQSLHDGGAARHEPLRLQVLVDAPRSRIEAILARHASLRNLVENEWLVLVALDHEGLQGARYVARSRGAAGEVAPRWVRD